MTFSLKNVTNLAIVTSGFALLATGCVADDADVHTLPGQRPGVGDYQPDSTNTPPLPPPVSVDPTEPGAIPPFPAVFAPRQVNPSNLIVSGDSIYWVQFVDNVVKLTWMHTDGGESFTVGDLDSLPFSSAADDAGIYFAASSEQNIVFAPHVGLDAQPLHSSTTDPLALQVTEDYAYWTAADGCLYRGAKEGGDTQEVACGNGAPISLSLAGGAAYWATTDGTLFASSLELGGGADKLLTGQDFSAGIVADERGVYWADAQQRRIFSFSFDTEEFRTLALSQLSPAGLAQDRFYLYFTTQSDGGIKRVLKTGNGKLNIMALGQNEPGQVVATQQWLYWINEGNGSVMRLLKNYNY